MRPPTKDSIATEVKCKDSHLRLSPDLRQVHIHSHTYKYKDANDTHTKTTVITVHENRESSNHNKPTGGTVGGSLGATHPHATTLTISCHDPSIWAIHHVPVFFGQGFNVPFAEIQDLLPQHGAALGLSSLLDGEVEKHHPPYEAKSHQEKAQLLRGQLPGSKESHLFLSLSLERAPPPSALNMQKVKASSWCRLGQRVRGSHSGS